MDTKVNNEAQKNRYHEEVLKHYAKLTKDIAAWDALKLPPEDVEFQMMLCHREAEATALRGVLASTPPPPIGFPDNWLGHAEQHRVKWTDIAQSLIDSGDLIFRRDEDEAPKRRDPRKLMCFQRYVAPHDSNGNPRRVFVGYSEDGNIVAVDDEGYSGRPKWTNNVVELPDCNVTAKEYRDFLRRALDG